jgi:MarR family transcriptional regulator, organic hydroperoxide resistance regulator
VTGPSKKRGHAPKRIATPAPDRPTDEELTATATDLLGLFRKIPHQVPPVPAADLTMGQIRLLFLLRREGPQPMGRLAEVFDLSPTSSSGFVARIERHGLVVRHHRSDDRRIVVCELTDDGTRFIQELSGLRIDSIKASLSALDATELAEFRRLLRRMHEQGKDPA